MSHRRPVPADRKVRSSNVGLLLDRHAGHVALRTIAAMRGRRTLAMPPRRVAISVLGAIGDTIVASALGLDIRRALPGVHITLIASATNRAVASVLPAFDDVLTVPTGRADIAARKVRKARFDVLIDCNQWIRVSALHAAFAGCTTIGFRTPGQARHFAYDHVVDHLNTRHELDNYRALLAPLGIKPQARPEVAITATARDAVAPMLAGSGESGTIVFHPWAGGRNGVMKEWPESHWVALGRHLRARGLRIYVTGGKADTARTQALVTQAAQDGVELHSLAGALPLDHLAALLAQVDAVVSVNTGIMHLAAAAGAWVVALEGPVNPLRWGPLSEQSISLTPVGTPGGYLYLGFEYPSNAPNCMATISVSAALDAVVCLVGGQGAAGIEGLAPADHACSVVPGELRTRRQNAGHHQPLLRTGVMDFSKLTVLCIGDVMLDRFIYGRMDRISPEAPVPIVRLGSTREMLGGAGNVANNIAALGGRTILTGLVGRDEGGRSLRAALAATAGVTDSLLELPDRPTICKTRLIAANQQVVRLDEESQAPLAASETDRLVESAIGWFGQADIIILSDYGKGVVSAELAARLIPAARKAGIPVFVDPKHDDFSRYRGATCIKPNLKELAAASRKPVESSEEVIAAARAVMAEAGAEAILATRSEKGMMLVEPDRVHSVEVRAREVFDVSGAGDTVIAMMALSYASGLSLADSIPFANAAASVVVSKLGTATASMTEVKQELACEEPGVVAGAVSPMPLNHVQTLVAGWKRQGLTVGFANGCFDMIHYGHVALFAFARANCDRLVVALNSDSSVRALKGPTRPMNTLELRSKVIAALRDVDCVVAFEEETPIELIRALVPDVLIKGADYRADQVVGGDIVRAAGGHVALAPLIDGQSSTRLHTLLAAE